MRYAASLFLACLIMAPVHGGDQVKIIVTSNLKGNFSPEILDQEKKDQLILLGQSIITEKRAGADMYIDLGNSFYPGVIAKYSYGSAVMDFFRSFDCLFTLVSSADIRIGVSNLEFLQKGNPTKLLSGNLYRSESAIFQPYLIHAVRNRKIAFIALSSRDVLVDAAEKTVYRARLEDEKKIVAQMIGAVKKEGANHIVLLSGLGDEVNFTLMKEFREIDLVMSGADNSGGVLNRRINRVEMHDRRNILGASQSHGYYLLDLDLGDRISVLGYRFFPARYHAIESRRYSEFIARLTRWKEHFRSKTGDIVATMRGASFVLNDRKVASLLMDRFNAEISMVKKNSLTPLKVDERIKESDILFSINDSYPVFTFRLTGSEISFLTPLLEDFALTGIVGGKVQGYELTPDRHYSIAATQSAYDEVQALLKRETPVTNTWMNINDLVTEDLKGRKVLLLNDYRYLDRRFRSAVDIMLSNYYNRTEVDLGKDVSPPAGKSGKSFRQWGIEDKVDLTLYNSLHQVVITPYIYYEKQDSEYLHNLMRGSVLYSLNTDFIIRAYHKSQAETVVRPVDGQKPAMIRETVGATIDGKYLKGKMGVGFEKEVRDPVNVPVYGLETILGVEYKFFDYFAYRFSLDSFIAYSTVTHVTAERGQRRIEMENALSFRVTEIVSLAVKHKWYRYYFINEREKYTNSQIVASLDMKAGFKLY